MKEYCNSTEWYDLINYDNHNGKSNTWEAEITKADE